MKPTPRPRSAWLPLLSSRPLSSRPLSSCVLACAFAVLALAGCATTPDRGESLHTAQYAWSAAIRWGDFEGAWTMVDPVYRDAHPVTPLELDRYKQVQVSAYHELGENAAEDSASRPIEIGVVNRNTQVERQARYLETWRYDPVAKHWWVTSGLPNLWQD
jgi:hypothetical protein